MNNSKVYIAVLDEVPDHMVPVLVAHSILGAHRVFMHQPNHVWLDWYKYSFRKVVLKVNRKEFNKIMALPHTHYGYENTVLEGEISCIVVCPMDEYPNVIKFAKMWKPNE